MVLPLGSFGPMVLDMTSILGTSPTGLSVNTSFVGYKFDSNLKMIFEERVVEALTKGDHRPSKKEVQKLYKNFFNYNTLITHFASSEGGKLKKGKHGAFLFYWYNKYFFYAKLNKCLAENMPVTDALASCHSLAFSSAVLANLTRCLVEATLGKIDPHQNGSL
ncbi:hypothetical protein ACFX1S_023073 [Malus domestica]